MKHRFCVAAESTRTHIGSGNGTSQALRRPAAIAAEDSPPATSIRSYVASDVASTSSLLARVIAGRTAWQIVVLAPFRRYELEMLR